MRFKILNSRVQITDAEDCSCLLSIGVLPLPLDFFLFPNKVAADQKTIQKTDCIFLCIFQNSLCI